MASDPWNGLPENPERDGKHLLRCDDELCTLVLIDWAASTQTWKAGTGGVMPASVAPRFFSEYLYPIYTPTDIAARVEGERERCAALIEGMVRGKALAGVWFSWVRRMAAAIRALGPTPAYDAAIKAAREDGMEAAVKIVQADERTYQGYDGCNPALIVPRIIAAIRAAKDRPA